MSPIHPPAKIHVYLLSQDVTLSGNRVFAEVCKLGIYRKAPWVLGAPYKKRIGYRHTEDKII